MWIFKSHSNIRESSNNNNNNNIINLFSVAIDLVLKFWRLSTSMHRLVWGTEKALMKQSKRDLSSLFLSDFLQTFSLLFSAPLHPFSHHLPSRGLLALECLCLWYTWGSSKIQTQEYTLAVNNSECHSATEICHDIFKYTTYNIHTQADTLELKAFLSLYPYPYFFLSFGNNIKLLEKRIWLSTIILWKWVILHLKIMNITLPLNNIRGIVEIGIINTVLLIFSL